jgi:hypothetical protein
VTLRAFISGMGDRCTPSPMPIVNGSKLFRMSELEAGVYLQDIHSKGLRL